MEKYLADLALPAVVHMLIGESWSETGVVKLQLTRHSGPESFSVGCSAGCRDLERSRDEVLITSGRFLPQADRARTVRRFANFSCIPALLSIPDQIPVVRRRPVVSDG